MKECIDTKTGWINCKYFHFNYKEIHHAYYGIILIIIGVILITPITVASGIIIFLDDLVQHILQGYKLKGESYISPLAKLIAWLGIYDTKFWKKLVEKYKFLEN